MSTLHLPLLRLVTAMVGALFVLQGILWWALPARVAEGLGMPLLDGVGRSTQIGDLGAFFLVAGATMLLGTRPGRARLLLVPAGAFALAATGRIVAWALHGADFAGAFIAVEAALVALLVAASRGGNGWPAPDSASR